jgi:hypothetical protein
MVLRLKSYLKNFNKIKVSYDENEFDYSILVIVGIAIISVALGVIWNRIRFSRK